MRCRRSQDRRPAGAAPGRSAVVVLAVLLLTLAPGCKDKKAPAPAPAPGAMATSSKPASISSAGSAANAPPPPDHGWSIATDPQPRSGPAHQIFSAEPALALLPGQALHPTTQADGLYAGLAGSINIPDPGRYRFTLDGAGTTASLAIYDKSAHALAELKNAPAARRSTDWVTLPTGVVIISAKFKRTADQPARARVLWERDWDATPGFAPEPIPTALTENLQRGAADSALALRGRILLGELGCIHCHTPATTSMASVTSTAGTPDGAATAGNAHPQHPAVLHRPAPYLGEVGRRASPDWLRAWVLDPQKIRPGTGMPRLFTDSPQDRADAEAVVQYLTSLQTEPPAAPAPKIPPAPSSLADGRRLYHSVGCLACHGPIDSPAIAFDDTTLSSVRPATTPRVPFGAMDGKWNQPALAEFLLDPVRVRPSGRMPSSNLTPDEAGSIATYLVASWTSPPPTSPPVPTSSGETRVADTSKAPAGRAVFEARGCAACHELGRGLETPANKRQAPGLASLNINIAKLTGCLNPQDRATPRYTLTDEDRIAIAAGIAEANAATGAPAPIDEAARLVEALNCRACHIRDGLALHGNGPPDDFKPYFRSLTTADLGDEGRLPPNLNGVGWKLQQPWLHKVLLEAGRARPYIATRMPQFGPAAVGHLPAALAATDGVLPDSPDADAASLSFAPSAPAPSAELIQAGHKLVGDTGLNCISCHVFGDRPPAGTPGPDMTRFAERIRPEWFSSYLSNPPRYKPGTRMPVFYYTGRGTVVDVFGGEREKQTAALWAYLSLGPQAPVPAGLAQADGHAITPTDKPIIVRSFLKDVGFKAIAVGSPTGIHYAFDPEHCRLASIWQGAFLDTSNAWDGRAGGEPLSGRGETIWSDSAPAVCLTAPLNFVTPIDSDERESAARMMPIPPTGFDGYKLEKNGSPIFCYHTMLDTTRVQIEEHDEPMSGSTGKPRLRRTFRIIGLPPGYMVLLDKPVGHEFTVTPAITPSSGNAGPEYVGPWKSDDPAREISITLEMTL